MIRQIIVFLFTIIFIVIVYRSWGIDYDFHGVDVYATLDSLVYSLEKKDITYYLGGGSALGAARRSGILKGDKDVDIFVAGAAPRDIEDAIWGFDWDYTDFGYHIHLQKTNFYFDIWVMQEKHGKLVCTGAHGKCHLWEEKFNWPVVVPINMVLPPHKHAFGTYMFNFPYDTYAYLDHEFPDWQNKCGGYRIGVRPCTVQDFE